MRCLAPDPTPQEKKNFVLICPTSPLKCLFPLFHHHRFPHLTLPDESQQLQKMSHSPATLQRQRAARRPIVTKASFSDDEDAITPCSSPPPEPQEACPHQKTQRFPSLQHKLSRNDSKSTMFSPKISLPQQSRHFDPTHGKDMSDSELWQRMLDIQRHFHCYNSARMSAALLELEMGVDAGHFARKCCSMLLLTFRLRLLPGCRLLTQSPMLTA